MRRSLESNLTAAARMLGKKGGKRGGPARARKLTDVQKARIAALGGKAKAAKGK